MVVFFDRQGHPFLSFIKHPKRQTTRTMLCRRAVLLVNTRGLARAAQAFGSLSLPSPVPCSSVQPVLRGSRFFGSSSSSSPIKPASEPIVLYIGPFSGLTLRLKRVSIFTATVGLIGMPLLLYLQTGTVPLIGQLAVTGTAILAAVGKCSVRFVRGAGGMGGRHHSLL